MTRTCPLRASAFRLSLAQERVRTIGVCFRLQPVAPIGHVGAASIGDVSRSTGIDTVKSAGFASMNDGNSVDTAA